MCPEKYISFPRFTDRNFLIDKKDAHGSIPAPQTSFTDYESPLRYYHAFRFHPRYSESVAGGLKSLTYSNRIDPKREICPDELDGVDCPRGNACQFQHFSNMVAPGESGFPGGRTANCSDTPAGLPLKS